jgi:DNA mismatch repair protein MSH4
MDWSTIKNLELISSLSEARATGSVLGVLTRTSTAAGYRLLRSSFLQPLTSKSVLERRLDAVAEFLDKEALFFDIQKALKSQQDLERILAVLVTKPAQVSMKFSEQRLNDVLLLKQALQAVPAVAIAMTRAESDLGVEVANLLGAHETEKVLSAISELIHDDTSLATSPLALRHQRCYAVKSGINGMLDLARQTYKELVDDMVALAARYAGQSFRTGKDELTTEEYEMPIQLQFDGKSGFYLSLSSHDVDPEVPLPDIFISQIKRKKIVQFSTLDVAKKNARIHEALNELLVLSDEAVEQLVDTIQADIGALYQLSEAVAVLDMIHAFASVAISGHFVRPMLAGTALGIKQGRHPVKEILEGFSYVANDTFADKNSRCQIITGCNMAGKTTYLRANAVMVILSQIG